MSVRVLVVEDEAIVAIDIAEQLTEAGFLVGGPAPSVAKALKLIVEVGVRYCPTRRKPAGRERPSRASCVRGDSQASSADR
jgi:hypothetical protein